MITDARLKNSAIDETELLIWGSATLYEASGLDCFVDSTLRPAWSGAEVVGRALPVVAAIGDNLALHHALDMAQPGDVLVVDGGGAPFGYWGEVMTVAAQARGVAGLVIDGGVRDTARLQELGFPAFSSHVSIRGTVKGWPGVVGQPMSLRGLPVHRGDLVIGDSDGVAVIPAAAVARTVTDARARFEKELLLMDRLRNGEATLDVYGFRDIGTNPVLSEEMKK